MNSSKPYYINLWMKLNHSVGLPQKIGEQEAQPAIGGPILSKSGK